MTEVACVVDVDGLVGAERAAESDGSRVVEEGGTVETGGVGK